MSEMTDSEWVKVLDSTPAKYCTVYNVPFQEHEIVMDVKDGDWRQETVNVVLTVSPNKIPRFGNQPISDNYVFSEQDTLDPVNFCSKAMKPGSYGHIICSDVQFLDGLAH